MRTDTYTVADIHCGGCERTIRTLVGDIEGLHEVKSDHRTNQVVISYDETLLDGQCDLRGSCQYRLPRRMTIGEVTDRISHESYPLLGLAGIDSAESN